MIRIFTLVFVLFFVLDMTHAQIQVSDASTGLFTPNDLIENVFLGNGVEIVDIQYNGRTNATGVFSNGMTDVGLSRGIILSTGLAQTAATPNNADNTSGDTSGSEIMDQDLDNIASGSLEDIARYVITFIPTSDTLRFNYVFASEEYPEFVCSNFNDVFGFFISGPRPGGGIYNAENIALIPDPAGNGFTNFPVSINSVNPGMIGNNAASGDCSAINESLSFSQFYNDNSGSASFTYDGYLDVFTAEAIVIPCQEYTIKLAVGDGTDTRFDSSVLLEAKSFGTSSLAVEIETVSIDGSLAESCTSGSISFSFESIVTADTPIDFSILTDPSLADAATEGVDFTIDASSIFIPQGQNSVDLPISALFDTQIEGTEFIYIDYQANICRRDTIAVPIRDNELLPQIMPADVTICNGESYFIDTELPNNFVVPTPPTFSYKGMETIGSLDGTTDQPDYIFPISVVGVSPQTLIPGLIDRICIDTFIALSVDMPIYEFYLISPDGQILELSTNNGVGLSDAANPLQQDTLLNLCFTEVSTVNVNNGNPVAGNFFTGNRNYTGSFQPEGDFTDLFDNNGSSNGTWQMFVRLNNAPIPFGIINNINQLKSWSIFFEAPYGISYEWDPASEVSCATCPDVTVSPTTDTEYTIVTTDSYGCEVSESITVSVRDIPPTPEGLLCNVLNNSTIQFTWDTPSVGFIEFMLNGDGIWNQASQNRIDIPGLGFDETQSISIRINNDGCIGPEVSTDCKTPSCQAPSVSVDANIPASCSYTADGSFKLSAIGGQSPYTYTSSLGSNATGLFIAVQGGSYTVTVTDDVNCSIEFNVIVDSPDSLRSDLSIINQITCTDDQDGEIETIVSGGTMPYFYSWNLSTDTDENLDNLSAGLYIVTITDDRGCEIIDSVELVNPDPLIINNINSLPIACGGDENGELYIDFIGGVGPYDFSWSNGVMINNDTLVNLASGLYEVTITDSNGCSAMDFINLLQPDPVVASFQNQPTGCHDSEDGVSEVVLAGGQSPYSLLWSNGSIATDAINLPKGEVTLTVTDQALCTFVFTTEITGPEPIDLNLSSDLVTCNGGTDGEIRFNPTGGTGNVTVLRNGILSSSPITNLSAGAYLFTAVDENNCMTSETITVNQPNPLTISSSGISDICFGESTGQIIITIDGGQGPYSYNWSGTGVSTEMDSIVENLMAGNYSVTVSDINNCSATGIFMVQNSDFIDYIITSTDVLCTGDTTGTARVFNVTGNPPFNINWENENGEVIGIDSTITGLAPGLYKVTISDTGGCNRIDSVLIDEPASLPQISFATDSDTICYGSNGVGSATISLSGGTGTLFAIWEDSGADDLTVFDLDIGYNSVLVNDAFGCETVDSFLVIEQDSIAVFLSSVDPSCNNVIDASVKIDSILLGNDLVAISNYALSWSSGDQDVEQISNLVGGVNYRVTVTDELNCTSIGEIRTGNPETIDIVVQGQMPTSCTGSNDGQITVAAIGGVAPYEFLWDINANFQDSSTAINLFAGQYIVTVTDINGCSSFETVSVEEPEPLVTDFRVFDNLCKGDSTGRLDVLVSGGTLDYTYLWSNGEDTREIDDLKEGLYKITITDANQCQKVDSIEISGPTDNVDFDVASFDVNCEGFTTGSFIVDASGGNGLYTYSIDGESFSANPEIIALGAGVYSITVRDNKGCQTTKGGFVIEEGSSLSVNLGPNVEIQFGADYVIPINTNGDFNDVTINWSSTGSGVLACDDCPDQVVQDVQSTTVVNVELRNDDGCIARDVVTIDVEKFIYVQIPTAFTPNDDGNNDILSVLGRFDAKVNYFRVYDRWGEKVYENVDFDINQFDIGWDGTYRNQKMPPGEYVWLVELELQDGSKEVFKGSTTLVR